MFVCALATSLFHFVEPRSEFGNLAGQRRVVSPHLPLGSMPKKVVSLSVVGR